MKSPFPGMDPYLEQCWGDVHARIVLYACDALQAKLPPDLRARVAVAEPIEIELAQEPVTETFLEFRDIRTGGRVITVVEVLSPSNKAPGDDCRLYEKKLEECRQAGVNFVEIDLLRAGQRILGESPRHVPPALTTPYQVCVWRATRPSKLAVYRVSLSERLPIIRMPLRSTDKDVPLDLQQLVDQAYVNGAYGGDFDYRADPVPPLEPADAAWAEVWLKEKGLR